MSGRLNHYERLGVDADSSATEIRTAYRRLARDLHPDHGRATRGEMAELNDAYSTLRDPARRAAYDRTLRSDARSAGPAANRVAPRDETVDHHRDLASHGDQAIARRLRLLVITAVAFAMGAMVVLMLVAFVEGH